MKFIKGLIFSLLPLLFALASCRRPASDEIFSFLDDAGYAEFTLDMSDTVTYSLKLYVYADAMPSPGDSLPIRLDYLSPENLPYSESLYLHRVSASEKSLAVELRTGFTPVCYGVWKAAVNIGLQNKEKYKITGAGLRLIRDNGTR